MMKKSEAVLSLLLLGLAPAAQAITGATPTAAFPAVGRGIQVAPDWVLTVYHYAYNVGDTYSNGYGDRLVAARYNAPGSGTFPANDLTLLRLAPIAGSSAVPYLAVNSPAVPDGSFAPMAVTFASSANTSAPRAYAYSTVSESQVMVDPDDAGPDPAVVANWLISMDSAVHVQDGDSGSGLFLGQVTNSSVLLGLASGLLTDANKNPVGSGYVQPGAYRSWIDSMMLGDPADNQAITWVSAVPEPATAVLWLGGIAALLAWRGRRGAR